MGTDPETTDEAKEDVIRDEEAVVLEADGGDWNAPDPDA